MAFLTDTDRRRIADAIRQAEARTSGEILTVITPASDDYRFVPLLIAAAIAFIAPGVASLVAPSWGFPILYALQLASFVVTLLVLSWRPITMRLIPASVKQERARRLAQEQFYVQGLHRTRDGTGLLLFVSVAEHYVEILADHGIDRKVPSGAWAAIIGDFTRAVRERRVAEGFILAVTECGDLLARDFPRRPDDKDELPNRLIEL